MDILGSWRVQLFSPPCSGCDSKRGGGAHVSSQLLRTRQRKLRGWEGDCVVPKLRQGSGFFGQWSAQTVLPQGLIP